MPVCKFVEERDTIVESRRQVVEVFLRERESVKANERLVGLSDCPILEIEKTPNIVELEKGEVGVRRRKSSAVQLVSKKP